ncbi:MAG TPA: trypsin-like peptidase domain-containing protein [Anaeromyxobacteraceae bacterium]|nr:trypsin-like peptidase domain-containing protein [Anaeromyxobacteraceae bacterium]
MTALATLSQDLAELVARAAPGVVGVERRGGQGSGIVLAQDGWVLTNAHVARGTGPLRIRLSGAHVAKAEVVGADARTDLAVARVQARDLPALSLSERRLRVGEIVVAIGNPLGFERSVTAGVVSALYRNLAAPDGATFEGLVQTDASINPGNSGGPLLDARGEVVGINTAMLPWARGIGFAVPAHTASWVASVLIRDGEVRRPFLGIAARGEDLEPGVATATGQVRAIRIVEVVAGSPADSARVAARDLLLAANGCPVQTLDDLQRVVVLSSPSEVALDVLRGSDRRRLAITPRPAARAAA